MSNIKYVNCFTKQFDIVLRKSWKERAEKRKKEKYITMSLFFDVTSRQAVKCVCKYFLH